VRLWLDPDSARALQKRRRWRLGPTGCGLCGVDSLEEAMRPLPSITSDIKLPPDAVLSAMRALGGAQPLHQATRAVHAAAFFTVADGLVAVREDVGRHNALDKVAGALVRRGKSAQGGLLLVTSRVSIELVQKAVYLDAPILAAISAPTAQALRSAEEAGLCVCGIVRDDGFEVFTHPERILGATRDGG
jgi:FdhD protein